LVLDSPVEPADDEKNRRMRDRGHVAVAIPSLVSCYPFPRYASSLMVIVSIRSFGLVLVLHRSSGVAVAIGKREGKAMKLGSRLSPFQILCWVHDHAHDMRRGVTWRFASKWPFRFVTRCNGMGDE